MGKKVLVTGSAGRLGRAAVKELKARGHFVRGLDLRSNPLTDDEVLGSIAEMGLVRRAVEGVDVIIHLAATPDDDDFLTKLVPNNCIGVYNLLESAKDAKVKRVMLASSGQVVWWHRFRGPFPIGTDVVPAPRGWYAALKLFTEGAGRAFSEAHGLSVLAVRLGWCPRDREHAKELEATGWGIDVYLSPGDAGRFFAAVVETEREIPFALLYAYSRPVKNQIVDMQPTRELLGFEPRDRWPEGSLEGLEAT